MRNESNFVEMLCTKIYKKGNFSVELNGGNITSSTNLRLT